MIQNTLQRLLFICKNIPDQIRSLNEDTLNAKSNTHTWSKKEILGHLCDSAVVNIGRIVRGQAEDRPQIFYDQDQWVNLQNYQSYPIDDLLTLWHSLNKHFYHLAATLSVDALNRICSDKEGNQRTLKFLIEDYLIHLQHHLHQILTIPQIV